MRNAAQGTPGWLTIILDLTRVRITFAVTLTTATGYILGVGAGMGRLDGNLWLAVLGVFLLGSGSSALNQVQDRRIDALMERTRKRPIPAGHLEPSTALFVAILLMLLGLTVLASVRNNTELLLMLGGFAVLWYNGVYTYLKRLSAFAVVPGALIGAIPPVIGYVAAGGSPTDPLVLLVGAFFFVWQIPHFWLLLLVCGPQYGRAGLPALTSVFSERQLLRITFMWLLATAAAGIALPAMAHRDVILPWNLAIVVASIWLAAKAAPILQSSDQDRGEPSLKRAFVQVNAYALVVMVCLSFSALGIATV